jgi:hypothetical protein
MMAWTLSGSGGPLEPRRRQGVAVAQHAHVLLGEQRVAAGGGQQRRADALGQPVVGEQRLQQPARVGL